MTELTDLSETDSANTAISGYSILGNIANMSETDNVIQAILGMLARGTNDILVRRNGPDTRRNRIVNGDMRVSQQNGSTSGTANAYYPVDQWAQYRITSAGTLTVAQVASVTPAGSPNRLRATVTVADAALAADEYWTLTQNLEGSNVADFQYGGSSAKASVLRFGFKGPAGTYAARIGNSATDRSFVALFTITAGQANTDTVQTVAIPGDTTGSWGVVDGGIGITLDIVLAVGTTYHGVAGWQAGTILGTSAVSNGMATAGAVFELFDVGLKLDPDATGVYGAYEVGEVDAKFDSGRYWRPLPFDYQVYGTAGSTYFQTLNFEEMAKTPIVGSFVAGASSNVISSEITVLSRSAIRAGFVMNATGNGSITGRVFSINSRLS